MCSLVFRGLFIGGLAVWLFGGWVGGLPGWLRWWGCDWLIAWWGQLGGVLVWCGRAGSRWLGPAFGIGFLNPGAVVRVARRIVVCFCGGGGL